MNKILSKKFFERGQIALIVLLVSAVVMTIGLSMSKKTVTETRIDTNEELLKQAFNAAESGIDYYLGSSRVGYSAPGGRSMANVSVSTIGGGSEVDYGEYVSANNTALFWLVNHTSNGDVGVTFYSGDTVDVCVDDDFAGALKLDYFSKQAGVYLVDRIGYNFNGVTTVDGFTMNSGLGGCVTVNTGDNPLLLAVTPIGGGTRIRIVSDSTSNSFPPQGEEIVSTGIAGDVSRKVTVERRYKVPTFMLEAVTAVGMVSSE